jgi:signal transduction histidine kinase
MKRVVGLFQMAAAGEGKNIVFRLTPSDGPFYCNVETERIRQATANLVRNAVEAVGDAGTVTIELYASKSPADCGGDQGTEEAPGREYACISVHDTGPGISEEVENKMFSPFFTTRDGGTGLGLHIVRKIANLHGGEIRYCRAEVGGGRFIIEIPRW